MTIEAWEAIAREEIRELVARYNANGDSARFDELMRLFWDDARMEIGARDDRTVYRGIDEIRTIFTGAAEQLRPATDPDAPTVPHHVRHCVSTLVIDLDDSHHARGYCYFHVIMPHGLDHWGRYSDRYEARDGQWRFAYRRVVREGGIDRDR